MIILLLCSDTDAATIFFTVLAILVAFLGFGVSYGTFERDLSSLSLSVCVCWAASATPYNHLCSMRTREAPHTDTTAITSLCGKPYTLSSTVEHLYTALN